MTVQCGVSSGTTWRQYHMVFGTPVSKNAGAPAPPIAYWISPPFTLGLPFVSRTPAWSVRFIGRTDVYRLFLSSQCRQALNLHHQSERGTKPRNATRQSPTRV